MVAEVVDHGPFHVAVLGACGEVDVAKYTLIHAFLHRQVEHGLLLTVVNAGDTGQVTLLVVGLQLIHHIHGEVLQAGLHVAAEELLAIHHQLLHLLTIDLHVTIFIHLGTGEFLDQLLQHSALGGAVSR